MRTFAATLLLFLVSACSSNRCLDMCQEYEIFLEECGYGWSTVFAEEGWTTLDDCYNAHWEAEVSEQEVCNDVVEDYQTQACF